MALFNQTMFRIIRRVQARPHHAVEEVEGSEADRLVLVVKALQNEVLVRLHGLRVGLQDLGHGQQAQVLH